MQNERLYTPDFILLCLSHAFFAASFTMIIPELPAYLESLGGAEYKGLIISLFTLMAGLSRPFSGKLSDTVGRVPVMIFGTLVCVVCSAIYPFATTVFGFLLLRFFHGFSTGFKPTASSAYVADIVPINRRGEAMGILGVSMNAGASIAPPIGSFLAGAYSLNIMFLASSGIALFSIVILLKLKETLEKKQVFSGRLLMLKKDELIDPKAIAPAIVALMFYFSFGAMLTIVPDQCAYLGMSNKGLYFASFTLFSILSRLVAGRASDRYGRLVVIVVSTALATVSLIYMGLANSPTDILVASGAVGFSLGAGFPAVFAWAIDRSLPERRGRAMATVFIALEISIGTGAILSAFWYDNNPDFYFKAFLWTGIITFLTIPYLWIYRRFRMTNK